MHVITTPSPPYITSQGPTSSPFILYLHQTRLKTFITEPDGKCIDNKSDDKEYLSRFNTFSVTHCGDPIRLGVGLVKSSTTVSPVLSYEDVLMDHSCLDPTTPHPLSPTSHESNLISATKRNQPIAGAINTLLLFPYSQPLQ